MGASSHARIAGLIGMAGAVLHILILILDRTLGLESGGGGIFGQLLSVTAIIAVNIGFLGLVWGGAFRGRFGTLAVLTHVVAYSLIVLGALLSLVLGDSESMHFVLFPIGGALEGVAQLLLIVAVWAATCTTAWATAWPD